LQQRKSLIPEKSGSAANAMPALAVILTVDRENALARRAKALPSAQQEIARAT
jgi:hypothetical protein